MTITPAKLADARARLKRGTSMDAAADAVGVSPDVLRAALAPKLLPVVVPRSVRLDAAGVVAAGTSGQFVRQRDRGACERGGDRGGEVRPGLLAAAPSGLREAV